MSGIDFDERASRRVEAAYLTPDVVEQRAAVLRALDLQTGESVLDVGSGPGLLAAEIAAAVGPSGRVCGVDPSDTMLAMAQERCGALRQVEFESGDAAKLPSPDESFDVVVSTQVFEYVPDVAGALLEARRVLRPGGRVAILDADYDSLVIHTEHPERMVRVLTAWDEHFVHPGLPRVLAARLREAGFSVRHASVVPMFNPEYEENSFSHHLLPMMAAFAVGRNGVTKEESDAWLAEFESLGAQGRYFYSLNRYLFVAEKPTES